MKIIIIKDRACRNSCFSVTPRKLSMYALFLVLFMPLAIGASSYFLAALVDRKINPFVDPEYRLSMESRVATQQAELANTRDYVRQHMDVLGSRVGSLQAQVSRINAVEMRIAESTGLDLEDFGFGEDPPIGGSGYQEEVDSDEVDIENAIQAIERELSQRESEITAVDFLLSRNQQKSKQMPSGWPVDGGWVSSKFGSRMHPITGKKQFHRGVDIPGKSGSSVLAVADGVIARAEMNAAYGWLVEIDHGDGYSTLYSHNRKNLVVPGDTIRKGQKIAEIGSSGRSTGPHVHFEVLKGGKNINPVRYLYKKSNS